jgi:PAS domain S-box-containing protein
VFRIHDDCAGYIGAGGEALRKIPNEAPRAPRRKIPPVPARRADTGVSPLAARDYRLLPIADKLNGANVRARTVKAENLLHRISRLSAQFAGGFGALAILGRILDAPALAGQFFGMRPMSPASALAFLLLGLGLWLIQHDHRHRFRRTGQALGLACAIISGSVVIEAHFGSDMVLPRLLFSEFPANTPSVANPLTTALPCMLVGTAVFCLGLKRQSWLATASWLGLSVISITLLAVTETALQVLPDNGRMALPSALCLFALGTGVTLSRADANRLRIISREHPLGSVALQLTGATLLCPVAVFGILTHWVRDISPMAHHALVLGAIVLNATILGLLVFLLRRMDQLDLRRRDAEGSRDLLLARLQQQAASLEIQVAERTQRLQETTDRLKVALRAGNCGVWDWDHVKQRGDWDEAQCALFGYKPGEFDGTLEAWSRRVHPDDHGRAVADFQRALASPEEEYSSAFRVLHPGGAVRHVQSLAFIHRDAGGQVVRVVGLNRDITHDFEMEESLRVAEERAKLALLGTNAGVWDRDLVSGVIYRDAIYNDLLGYVPGEIEGLEGWLKLIHPDDKAEAEASLHAHLEGRADSYRCEYRMWHKDGRWVWMLDRGKVVKRDPAGRALRIVGTHTDITPRKTMEEQLRRSEELSLQLNQLARIGAWQVDMPSGRTTWAPEIYRLCEVDLGFSPTVEKMLQFAAAESRPVFSEAMTRLLREGTPFDLELSLQSARGNALWVRVLGRAELKAGRPVRAFGVFQDISARRDSEEMRRNLESQLFQAQKMETLGTLAGGIAHDFNNLLTGILGYQDLALDTLLEMDPARNYLGQAREASLRARELIDQILTFSRQTGSEKLPVNLTQVAEDARRFLRATVPATISIEMESGPDCPRVLADSTQIHQVLLNLGSNAAHAMRAGGGVITIKLTTITLDENATGLPGSLAPGRYVRLDFSDTGHGMDEATLKRIFDPFFTTKEVGQGTGLGLSVVHGIMEAHKGAITVRSAPGQGTTFTLHLPEAQENSNEPGFTAGPIPRGQGELIAVVDDEDIVRGFAQMALEKIGYRVAAFDSPAECLEVLRREHGKFSLLLTDQTMPVMKGIELASEVRSFAPQLPIVIMSGYFSRISPDKLAQIGQIALLSKPFTNDELGRTLHKAIHPEAE